MGTLYIVGTPIGNLEDMTLRAIRILGEVDQVACEDTRRTRTLFSKHGIRTRMLSYHDHNKEAATRRILARLERGEEIALVSDAGTPTIADPGLHLVRAAVARGVRVVPLPGASALLAALSASGLPTAPFTFLGYLPRGLERVRRVCTEVSERAGTIVCLDSPRRLARDLAAMAEILGARGAVVARELTKVHEEFLRGDLVELARRVGEPAEGGVRGEVVILFEGAPERRVEDDLLRRHVVRRLDDGDVTARDLARELAEAYGIERNRAYRLVLDEIERRSEAAP